MQKAKFYDKSLFILWKISNRPEVLACDFNEIFFWAIMKEIKGVFKCFSIASAGIAKIFICLIYRK